MRPNLRTARWTEAGWLARSASGGIGPPSKNAVTRVFGLLGSRLPSESIEDRARLRGARVALRSAYRHRRDGEQAGAILAHFPAPAS